MGYSKNKYNMISRGPAFLLIYEIFLSELISKSGYKT